MNYQFNDFTFDTNNFAVKKNNIAIDVEPLVFDLAIFLLENRERVVTREEIFDNVWGGKSVLDSTLSNHIKILRSLVGDDGKNQLIIKTIRGRGYQFVAEVKTLRHQVNSISTTSSHVYNENKTSIESKRLSVFATNKRAFLLLIGITVFLLIGYLLNQNNSASDRNEFPKKVQDKSIAVLAFKDMSFKQNQSFFAEGISEEILNILAKIRELKVISRTSSFSYKDKSKDIKTIARELDVRYVIEGSVRIQDESLRITVQLIDASDGAHVWSEVYDKEMPDIFEIQDEIAEIVAQKLKLTLFNSIPKVRKLNPEAYVLYLEANAVFSQHTSESTQSAKTLVNQSIEIDSSYAPAWNLLSNIYYRETTNLSLIESRIGYRKQRETAERSLKLDESFAPAHASLARIDIHEWKHHSAIKHIKRALELNKGNPDLIAAASDIKFWAGYLKESTDLIRQAIKIDPLTYINFYNMAIGYYVERDFDQALAAIDKYILYQPTSEVARAYRAFILLKMNQPEKAHQAAKFEKNGYWKLYSQSKTFFATGKKLESDAALNEFIKQYAGSDPSTIADIYAFRKDKENTYKWLQKALETQDDYLIETIQYPSFSFLHQDKRWLKILNTMNLFSEHWLFNEIE